MKNKGNILIVLLMGIIIVILAVLCVLFATDTIKFNSKVINNSDQNTSISKDNKASDDSISNQTIPNDMKKIAENLGDKLYKNLYSFNSAWVFCGENMKWNNEEDFIPYEETGMQSIHKYDVSQDFKTIEELNNYFKSFMSENLINKYYKTNSGTYAYKNGKYIYEIYLEKDGKLYCKNSNKDHGFIMYEKNDSNYRIVNYNKNKIDVVANVGYFEKGSDIVNESEVLSYSVIKENNNWIINSFIVIPDGVVSVRSIESYLNDIADYNDNSDNKIIVVYNDKEYTSKNDFSNIVKLVESNTVYVTPNGEKWSNFNIIYNEKGYVSKVAIY